MLTFGVTVLPDPPYTRACRADRARRAARASSTAGPTTRTSSGRSRTRRSRSSRPDRADQARPLRHEPRDPRPDDHRELVRDDARHLERPDGDGDRPRRLVAARRRPQAGAGRRVRGATADDQGPDERPRPSSGTRRSSSSSGCAELPEIEVWIAGYGPKALAVAGRVGDGVIIQLADPQIIQWIMDTARRVGRGGRARPERAQVHRRRAEHDHRRPRRRARAGALVPGHGLEPRHGPDRALRLGLGDPDRAHRLRQGAQVLRLQGPQPRRRGARRVRHRRDLRPLLRARQHRAGRPRSCASSSRSASTSSTST